MVGSFLQSKYQPIFTCSQVQDKSADLLMWLDLADGLIAVVTNIFLGAYSDTLGRKFILLLPLLGHFLRSLTTPVIIYWDLGLTALYSGYVIDGICGGSPGDCSSSLMGDSRFLSIGGVFSLNVI